MGLTDEVDTGLLHQCFELQHFDNLLKPELMDAITKRREHLAYEAQYKAETERIEFLKTMKTETIKSHLIALRISLQEHILDKEEVIDSEIKEIQDDEEKLKKFDKEQFLDLIKNWLSDFKLTQPSQFLSDNPTNDNDLSCCILSESEFLLSTLRYFGLPKDYLNGEGHFPTWEKDRLKAKIETRKKQKDGKADKKMSKVERLKKERARKMNAD